MSVARRAEPVRSDAPNEVLHADVLLEQRFPADPCQLRDLRSQLRGCLDALAIEHSVRERLVLAVDEACCNIVRHAYGSGRTGPIDIRLTHTNGLLSFELTDAAPCVDPARIKPKPLGECRAGGFGVALIEAVMDDWHIEPQANGCGNRLLMRKRVATINEKKASRPT